MDEKCSLDHMIWNIQNQKLKQDMLTKMEVLKAARWWRLDWSHKLEVQVCVNCISLISRIGVLYYQKRCNTSY